MQPPPPPLLGRLRPAHLIAIDCAVTAVVVPVSAISARGPTGPRWVVAAVVLLAALAAALRRRWPPAVLAAVVVAGGLATGVSRYPTPWLAAAFAMYLVPLRFPRREALWLLGGALLAVAVGLVGLPRAIALGSVPDRAQTLVESASLITIAWTTGYAARQQRLYAAGRHEQAEQRAREQVAEARRAMSEERLRIARELHDVVAHTMSLIAVQAGVANHVAAEHPEEARRALSSIEETSRDALREMRALLGVLRDEQERGPAPVPGLDDLGTLVERGAEAGVRVDLDVAGQRPRLPAGLELAAYRIVQEAVTNVVKHSGADRCRVGIAYRTDAVTLTVTDDGTRPGDGTSAGHGIAGMRERVAMYGGDLRAAPLPVRGFQVTARFPLATTAVP